VKHTPQDGRFEAFYAGFHLNRQNAWHHPVYGSLRQPQCIVHVRTAIGAATLSVHEWGKGTFLAPGPSEHSNADLSEIYSRKKGREMNIKRLVLLVSALLFSCIAAAACGRATTPRAVTGPAATGTPLGAPLNADEALLQDAQQYAQDVGVDLDEAVRRLQYQDDIGRLNATLTANERESFAGLWVEHQPDFRVIVRFTRAGRRMIRPYIKGEPWADLVEVRSASVTLAELEAIQAQTTQALERLDFEVISSLDVKGNRVEVYVTDREWFEKQLEKAGIDLPKQVELVLIEGHSAREIDVCAPSAVPGIAFPRQEPVEGVRATMAAELIGHLVLVDGCLRVNSIYGEASYLPVWPPEFTLTAEDDGIQVRDGDGQVVARVGEEVYVSGGEGSAASMPECVREQLPAVCTGPYWIVGDTVRPNLRHDSELFSLDVISTTEQSLLFLGQKPVLDEWADGDSVVAGRLVLYDYQRCPRVVSDDGLTDYVPLWPPDYGVRVANGAIEILDGSGQVVARVGEEAVLAGASIPVVWDSEAYQRLRRELPGDCHGPYWIVKHR